MNIGFVGAKGGQGTSTVATVVALAIARERQVHLQTNDPEDNLALIGAWSHDDRGCVDISPNLSIGTQSMSGTHRSHRVTIEDHGTTFPALGNDERTLYTVLRGPCYVALRRALTQPRTAGVILITEDARSLGRRDVEDVLGIPVLAELPINAAIARSVDAGLLGTRIPKAFEPLTRHFVPSMI